MKVPIVALHGEADAVVPVELPRATTSLLVDKAGCDATLRTWPGVEHQITAEMQQVLYAELGRMLPKR